MLTKKTTHATGFRKQDSADRWAVGAGAITGAASLRRPHARDQTDLLFEGVSKWLHQVASQFEMKHSNAAENCFCR